MSLKFGEEHFPGADKAEELAQQMVSLMELGLQALSRRQVSPRPCRACPPSHTAPSMAPPPSSCSRGLQRVQQPVPLWPLGVGLTRVATVLRQLPVFTRPVISSLIFSIAWSALRTKHCVAMLAGDDDE